MRPTNRVLQDLQKRIRDIRIPEDAYDVQPKTDPAVRETATKETPVTSQKTPASAGRTQNQTAPYATVAHLEKYSVPESDVWTDFRKTAEYGNYRKVKEDAESVAVASGNGYSRAWDYGTGEAEYSASKPWEMKDQARKDGDSNAAAKYQYQPDQEIKKRKYEEYKTALSGITMSGSNRSLYEEALLVAAMEDGKEKKQRKEALLKEIKAYMESQSGSKWEKMLDQLGAGAKRGDIMLMGEAVLNGLFGGNPSPDGYDENEVYALLTGEARDANLLDVTWNSLTRGYNNARYGEESYAAMNGTANEKEKYQHILADDKYQFATDNWLESGTSGVFEQLGQQVRQWTTPESLAAGTAAAVAAGIAGQAGPQVLAPEEIITMPSAFLVGLQAGSAAQALQIEAGHAYNEMIAAGISEKTAKKIAMAVGTVNAGLEMLQLDELLDAYKITKASGATKSFTKRILEELVDRGIDVAKETGQEVLQEGVTMAGVQAVRSTMTSGHILPKRWASAFGIPRKLRRLTSA